MRKFFKPGSFAQESIPATTVQEALNALQDELSNNYVGEINNSTTRSAIAANVQDAVERMNINFSRRAEPIHVMGRMEPSEYVPGNIEMSFTANASDTHYSEPINIWNQSNMNIHVLDPFEEFRDEMQALKDRISQLEMLLLEN